MGWMELGGGPTYLYCPMNDRLISPHAQKHPSDTKQQRQQAEEELQRLYNEPRAALLLFQIIELHAAGPTEPDVSIRKAAAVSFKARARLFLYVYGVPEPSGVQPGGDGHGFK